MTRRKDDKRKQERLGTKGERTKAGEMTVDATNDATASITTVRFVWFPEESNAHTHDRLGLLVTQERE